MKVDNDEKICWLCSSSLADSKEHLIPQGIGGRKEVKDFSCIKCNTNSGKTWDSKIVKQLKFFSHSLSIKRQRNKDKKNPIKITTSEGDDLELNSDGTLSLPFKYENYHNPDGTRTINITVRNKKEAQLKLNELKKIDKNAKLKIDEKISYGLKNVNLNFSLDVDCFKSAIKTAMIFACANGFKLSDCLKAKNFIYETETSPCYALYYTEKDIVIERGKHPTIFHCVALAGDPKNKKLLAYVEYFSSIRILICLSDGYNGEPFSKSYAINPLTGVQISKFLTDLNFTCEDLDKVFNYESYSQDEFKKALKALSLGIHSESTDRTLDSIVGSAFEKMGGKEISAENRELFMNNLWDELCPYIDSRLFNRR